MESKPEFKKIEESIEPILKKIMTAEEYSDIDHNTPYIFELKLEDKELFYFGTYHCRDMQDPLFDNIEQSFKKINPDIVFVEGVSRIDDKARFSESIKSASKEKVIDYMGESGFTIKLAVEKGIEWESPEPSDKELYTNLLQQGFSKEELFAWEVIHVLPQYFRQNTRIGFENYVQRFMDSFQRETLWENFDYSYKNAISICEKVIGKSINVENEPNALSFADPIPREETKQNWTVFNSISKASSVLRDRKMVADLIEANKKYKRIFVVFGASHGVMQESALNMVFKQQK